MSSFDFEKSNKEQIQITQQQLSGLARLGATAILVEQIGQDVTKDTLTIINAFKLEQFNKIVLMDPDMLPLKKIDFLFSFPGPSCVSDFLVTKKTKSFLSTSLMVVNPSQEIFEDLMRIIRDKDDHNVNQHKKIPFPLLFLLLRLHITQNTPYPFLLHDSSTKINAFEVLNLYFGAYWFNLPLTYNVPIALHYGFNNAGHNTFFWESNQVRVLNYLGARPWNKNPSIEYYKEFFDVYNSLGKETLSLLK